ncbi:hypothetical protein Chor_004259 [Crotalus horridus]
MAEWRQCGRWLIDCKVLPANHRVVWPSAVVFELAQALRDGVLLCQLLHNLSPGSVDLKDINFRPQMSQLIGFQEGSEHLWPGSSSQESKYSLAFGSSPGLHALLQTLGSAFSFSQD